MSFRNKVLSTESRSCASPTRWKFSSGPSRIGRRVKSQALIAQWLQVSGLGDLPLSASLCSGGPCGHGGGAASQTDGHSRACWSTPPVHKDLKQGGGASPDRCSAQA